MTRPKLQTKVQTKAAKRSSEEIVIDADRGWVFSSEDELYRHFEKDILKLEKQFTSLRSPGDISESDFKIYEKHLNDVLEAPDFVWIDRETLKPEELTIFLRNFARPDEAPLFHIAVAYVTQNMPSFVYLHFPTRDESLVNHYQRGELVFDRELSEVPLGAIEGDALFEQDPYARGLYEAMIKLRIKKDILERDFRDFAKLREEAVQDADEIWRNSDSLGNVMVTFIKEYPETEIGDFTYVVCTLEDPNSNSHSLLFSFPTRDKSLVDRYRHGENLHAEEVIQESSH